MKPTNCRTINYINSIPIKVWVLAPSVETLDDNLDYYYDFSQSIAEYEIVFAELNIAWQWQPVTLLNFKEIIHSINQEKNLNQFFPVVLNLCDGDEINNTPGISVVRLLEKYELVFTGADEFFYEITTSKISMKKAFDKFGVSTAKWKAINNKQHNYDDIFEQLGTPLIVKPSVSGGSMGVGTKNVIDNKIDLQIQVDTIFSGYRGWNLVGDGVIAESFINGPEYTVLIVGSFDKPEEAIIYNPVERVFHASLPEHEKFLSFDRLWEIYEDETEMPNQENFFEYGKVDVALEDKIKKISWDAYVAVRGTGYTRIDLRCDKNTGSMYVLEVNAQCGISNDEDFTSIGAILKLSGNKFTDLVKEIILNALRRKNIQLND